MEQQRRQDLRAIRERLMGQCPAMFREGAAGDAHISPPPCTLVPPPAVAAQSPENAPRMKVFNSGTGFLAQQQKHANRYVMELLQEHPQIVKLIGVYQKIDMLDMPRVRGLCKELGNEVPRGMVRT